MSLSRDPATDATVLVVDDIPANRNILRETLEAERCEVLIAPDGATALRVAAKALPDVILLDVMMPGIDGFDTCRRIKEDDSLNHIPVIFITANSDMDSLVKGFEVGGVDYITKPFQTEEVLMRVGNHLKISRLTKDLRSSNEELRAEIARREQAEAARERADGRLSVITEREAERWGIDGFVGKSTTFKAILQSIARLRQFSSTSVLITGESGTGKELVARAIHFGSEQADAPFIPVNCSAIPDQLMESLFFGHVKGSFSGAVSDRKGYFQLADGGTLFLDEVGEMPLALQSVLLRVLEDGEVRPVGSDRCEKVGVRVIAASNVDFQRVIADGRFRKDLFFRLARFTIDVPPLRERREDVPLLVEHFLRLFSSEINVARPRVSDGALARLCRYCYPGNIRELKNILERAVIEAVDSGEIRENSLHFFHDAFDSDSGGKTASDDEAVDMAGVDGPDPEALVIAHLGRHGIINNTVCRQLLDVDRNRSSYLLRKLEKQGLLVSEGQGRWAQYRLAE